MTFSGCGYHSGHRSQNGEDHRRDTPWPFTGCLAHLEIVSANDASGMVFRVSGHFEHVDECIATTQPSKIPRVPVAPAVLKASVQMMVEGIPSVKLCSTPWILYCHSLHKIMAHSEAQAAALVTESVTSADNHRQALSRSDGRTVYRAFHRAAGVQVGRAPHLSVDDWLHPLSSSYRPVLAQVIFGYAAKMAGEAGSRLQMVLATAEMRQSARRYCHKGLMQMDGTFGVCDSKVLLFVLLGLDEDYKGEGSDQCRCGRD
jgi:hypothetical protein